MMIRVWRVWRSHLLIPANPKGDHIRRIYHVCDMFQHPQLGPALCLWEMSMCGGVKAIIQIHHLGAENGVHEFRGINSGINKDEVSIMSTNLNTRI